MGNLKKRKVNKGMTNNVPNNKIVSKEKFSLKEKIICIFTFVVCLIIGLGTFFGIRNINNNKLNVNFKCTILNKDLGNVNSLTKSKSNYGYCVFYPTFNNSTIDDVVEKQNKTIINAFLKEYKSYKIIKKGYIDIPDEEFYSNRYFYVKEEFYYLLKEFETKKIKIKYELEEKYDYKDNDNIGKLYVYLDKEKIFTTDIYISIKKKKIKIKDWILDFFD